MIQVWSFLIGYHLLLPTNVALFLTCSKAITCGRWESSEFPMSPRKKTTFHQKHFINRWTASPSANREWIINGRPQLSSLPFHPSSRQVMERNCPGKHRTESIKTKLNELRTSGGKFLLLKMIRENVSEMLKWKAIVRFPIQRDCVGLQVQDWIVELQTS